MQSIQFAIFKQGYFDFEKKYIYNDTDHLRNMILSYLSNSNGIEIFEENNYYPFGLKHEGYKSLAGNPAYQMKYNGKELQETGMYDYGARFYLPDIGRKSVVDPKAGVMPSWSPYSAFFNNPLRFTDPNGMAPEDWVGCKNSEGSTNWKWDDYIKSADQAKAAGYDDYKARGSIIDNAKIGGVGGTDGKTSVYLGNNKSDGSFTYPNKTVTPFQVGTEWL